MSACRSSRASDKAAHHPSYERFQLDESRAIDGDEPRRMQTHSPTATSRSRSQSTLSSIPSHARIAGSGTLGSNARSGRSRLESRSRSQQLPSHQAQRAASVSAQMNGQFYKPRKLRPASAIGGASTHADTDAQATAASSPTHMYDGSPPLPWPGTAMLHAHRTPTRVPTVTRHTSSLYANEMLELEAFSERMPE